MCNIKSIQPKSYCFYSYTFNEDCIANETKKELKVVKIQKSQYSEFHKGKNFDAYA